MSDNEGAYGAVVFDEETPLKSVGQQQQRLLEAADLGKDVDDDDDDLIVTAVFTKPTKQSNLGVVFNLIDNQIVITRFTPNGVAASQPHYLQQGMTLVSLNGVNFEDDEEATPVLDGSNGDESTTKAKLLQVVDIMRNAEDTVTIVARKGKQRTSNGGGGVPPPGVVSGGSWGTSTYWGTLSQVSTVFCCLLGGWPVATIMCCLSFDKRRVYKVNDKYYGESGELLRNQRSFVREEYDSNIHHGRVCLSWTIATFAVIVLNALYIHQRY